MDVCQIHENNSKIIIFQPPASIYTYLYCL